MLDKKAIAARIQEIMQKVGITQKGLADYLGISQPAVSLYLQGRIPPAEILLQIARVGHTTMEWILIGEKSAPGTALQVREPLSIYGHQTIILELWSRLPDNLQRDLLTLLRHIVENLPRNPTG